MRSVRAYRRAYQRTTNTDSDNPDRIKLEKFRMLLIDELAPGHDFAVSLYRHIVPLAKNEADLQRYTLAIMDIEEELQTGGHVVGTGLLEEIAEARKVSKTELGRIYYNSLWGI